MITLTKLNGTPFLLNDDLVETVEETPDTTIRLTNGHLFIVRESAGELADKIVAFRREILKGPPAAGGREAEG